jgi:glycosyltransferase involved in cell wall biosynthesis
VTPRLLFTGNWDRFFVSHRLVLAAGARAAGYDVHVAVPPGDCTDPILEAGFPVHHFPMSRSGTSLVSEARTIRALTQLYRRLQPDIVHQVAQKAVLYGTIAARLNSRRIRVVNALAGMGYVFLANGLRAAVSRAALSTSYRTLLNGVDQRLILQNHVDTEFFASRRIVARQRIKLIRGSGVDLDRFRHTPEPEGAVVVVLAARLLWHKGVGEFVEAARQLRSEGHNARFVLVGATDGGNRATVTQQTIEQWVHDGIVEYWGHRSDMDRVFASCHVACLPSYREGLPKVLLEAAAAGRPLVASDEPGCREVVVDGITGFLAPVGDAVGLANAIRPLLGDAALRQRLGAAARLRAEECFGVDSVIQQTLEVYAELLA